MTKCYCGECEGQKEQAEQRVRNDMPSAITIGMKNVDHAAKVYDALRRIFAESDAGGDLSINGLPIGHDVRMPVMEHVLNPSAKSVCHGRMCTNRKTGKRYRMLSYALDATNGRDGVEVVVYEDPELMVTYVRELAEFDEKFAMDVDAAKRPTTADAINELAVYEWPDDTWCWHHELGEMTHMSDDRTLVWYDPTRHC